MTFLCNGCNLTLDLAELVRAVIVPKSTELTRYCKGCCQPRSNFPDVFWDGKPEEGLADDPRTGKPRVFSSKGEKATYLKEHGLQEAGDRIGGSDISPKGEIKTDSREEVMRSLQKVKNMGQDYRRSEYQRIIKEGRKYA